MTSVSPKTDSGQADLSDTTRQLSWATKSDDPYPALLATRPVVLLIFFMPPARAERAPLAVLTNLLQGRPGGWFG